MSVYYDPHFVSETRGNEFRIRLMINFFRIIQALAKRLLAGMRHDLQAIKAVLGPWSPNAKPFPPGSSIGAISVAVCTDTCLRTTSKTTGIRRAVLWEYVTHLSQNPFASFSHYIRCCRR